MIELREIRLSDANTILNWKRDPYLISMAMDPDYETSLFEQEEDIKIAIKDEYSEYKMIIESGGKPIGYLRIDWMNSNKDKAWLRFALGESRGKGIAYLALFQYIKELLNNGCKRIEAEVYESNIPSQKTLEKLGFRLEGKKRKAHFDGTGFQDIFSYGLLKEEFIEKGSGH